jgi:hypothetical protein
MHFPRNCQLTELNYELETNFENTQSKQLDEEQTLHDVAKYLRSSLQSLEMSNEYYPLPSEVSITESCKFSDTVIELLNIVLDLPCPRCFSTIMAFPK